MRAHWHVPDSINETTTGAIIRASILNTSYPSAPVSTLYLFNRPQEQAFEYPTASVRQRHHVRLRMATKRVANQEVWIGAASYDSGIELSGTNHLPTHQPQYWCGKNISCQIVTRDRIGCECATWAANVSDRMGYEWRRRLVLWRRQRCGYPM